MDIQLFGIASKTWKMGLSEATEQMDTMKMMFWDAPPPIHSGKYRSIEKPTRNLVILVVPYLLGRRGIPKNIVIFITAF